MTRILMEKVTDFIYSCYENMHHLQLKLINLLTWPTPKKETFLRIAALPEEVV